MNLLDLIAEDDLKQTGHYKWTQADIVSNLSGTYIGGGDSVLTLSLSALDHMSTHPEIIEQLRAFMSQTKESKGADFRVQDVLDDEGVENFTLESLRMFAPVPISTIRVFSKNTTIEGVKLRKGDLWSMPLSVKARSHTMYEDAETFDINRLNKEYRAKIDKAKFLPFSSGHRQCVGNFLASMMYKLFMYSFLENFEFKAAEDYERRKVMTVGYGLEKCILKMKPRRTV